MTKVASAVVLATAVGIMVLGVTSAQLQPNRRRVRRNRAHPIKSVQYTRELLAHAVGSEEQARRARDFRFAVVGFNRAGKEFEIGVVDSFERAQRLADRHADRYLSVAVFNVEGGDMVYQPRRMAANVDLGRWLVVRQSRKAGRRGATLSLVVDEGATLQEAHWLAQLHEQKTGKKHHVRPAPSRVGHPLKNARRRT